MPIASKDMHNAQHWYEYGLMRAPGLVRLALEWRAPWELGAAVALRPLLNLAPAGDGQRRGAGPRERRTAALSRASRRRADAAARRSDAGLVA